jgi:hypothetical protein
MRLITIGKPPPAFRAGPKWWMLHGDEKIVAQASCLWGQ